MTNNDDNIIMIIIIIIEKRRVWRDVGISSIDTYNYTKYTMYINIISIEISE